MYNYKYSCRDCRIRERCIDQNESPAHIKSMIRTAFDARTDTVSMWAILQKSCLLVQQDEQRERKAGQESLLARRLREAREAEQRADEASVEVEEAAGQAEPVGPTIFPADQPTTTEVVPPDELPDYVQPASEPEEFGIEVGRAPGTAPIGVQLDQPPVSEEISLYWLILEDSGRRISLPGSGTVILGRFDPDMTDPLDIDLSFEDRESLSVSRRHAQIVGVDGTHLIQDLGSANGVFINNQQIPAVRPFPLEAGDQIAFSTLRMRYEEVPADFLRSPPVEGSQVRAFLLVTHTGGRIELTPPDDMIIGRADPDSGFVPAVDLSREGEVAVRVSRRHARIIWRNHRPYLKDLSSTFGTRIGGKRLLPDQLAPLKPGDHMSLGGCVLAYDVDTSA
jgi:pSer/pThr/pTyr-binding forkhead associated (FHA) protein